MPGAAEDAGLHGLQRKDVSRLHEVAGLGVVGCEKAQGVSPVGGGNSGGDTLGGVYGNGESRFVGLAVLLRHWREVEFLGFVGENRSANQAPAMIGHEGNHFGRGQGSGPDEVGFIFPPRVVGHDDHLAGLEVGDDFVDGRKFQ